MTDCAASLVAALEAKKYPAPLAYDQSIWNAAINEAIEVVRAPRLLRTGAAGEPGVVLRVDEAEQMAVALDVTVEQLRAIEREVLTRDATFRAGRHHIQGGTPPALARALEECRATADKLLQEHGDLLARLKPVTEEEVRNAARNYVTKYSEADRPCGDGERLLTVIDREALIRLGVALGGAR